MQNIRMLYIAVYYKLHFQLHFLLHPWLLPDLISFALLLIPDALEEHRSFAQIVELNLCSKLAWIVWVPASTAPQIDLIFTSSIERDPSGPSFCQETSICAKASARYIVPMIVRGGHDLL
jgi:hypothetical protein